MATRDVDKKFIQMTPPPEPLMQIKKKTCHRMFIIVPATKFAQTVPLR